MKTRMDNMSDSEKNNSNETTTNKSNTSEGITNVSSNVASNTSSADFSNAVKKDINYIFQLNVTKGKLQNIQKKIDKLTDKAQTFSNLFQEKYSMVNFHKEQIYLTELEYLRQLNVFHQNMNFYNISDISILTDLSKRNTFLDKYQDTYLKQTILPLLAMSSEQDPQKLEHIKNSLLDQEMQKIEQILEQLHIMYLNIVVEQQLLDEKKKKFEQLKKEINFSQQEYARIQATIQTEQQRYQDVTQHGLLKAYEVS